MARDKVGVSEQIGFVLNGKPIGVQPTLICPKCGVDRLKNPCPNQNSEDCPQNILRPL